MLSQRETLPFICPLIFEYDDCIPPTVWLTRSVKRKTFESMYLRALTNPVSGSRGL